MLRWVIRRARTMKVEGSEQVHLVSLHHSGYHMLRYNRQPTTTPSRHWKWRPCRSSIFVQHVLAFHHLDVNYPPGILQHNTQDWQHHQTSRHHTLHCHRKGRFQDPHSSRTLEAVLNSTPNCLPHESPGQVLANYRQLGSSPLHS